MERSCGNCSACCKVVGVHELNKPAGQPCRYQKGGAGCQIYESRPPSCRVFACQWLRGFGGEEDRPNITKIVIDLRELPNPDDGCLVQLWEVQHGALDSKYAAQVTKLCLANGFRVSHLSLRGEKKLYLPGGLPAEKILEIKTAAGKEGFEVFVFIRTR